MKVPDDIIKTLESQLNDLPFGIVNLEISIHDAKPKFRIIKQISLVPGRSSSGETPKKGE